MRGSTSLHAVRVVAVALCLAVCATTTAHAETNMTARVASIMDKRSSLKVGSTCSVTLEFSGPAFDAGALVTEGRIKRVVDDRKNDLTLQQSVKVRPRSGFGRHAPQKSRITFDIEPPARTAKALRLIQGECILVSPRAGASPFAVCRDFRNSAGEYVINARLAQHGVKIAYVSKDSVEFRGEALARELVRIRLGGEKPERIETPFIESTLESLKERLQANPAGGVLAVVDPGKKVLSIDVIDPEGERVAGYLRTARDFWLPIGPAAANTNTWLRVHLDIPEAQFRVPFTIRDAPLP